MKLNKKAKLNKLWEKLFGENPTNNDLCRIIVEHVESLRIEAWQKLLKQNPDNSDLYYINKYVKSLRRET